MRGRMHRRTPTARRREWMPPLASPRNDDSVDCVVSGSCSITVSIGEQSTTFTPSIGLTARARNVSKFDICFAERSHATSGYVAKARRDCKSTETDSSTAITDGLPVPATNNTAAASN